MKNLIEKTPLLKINYRYKNKLDSIYVKLEYFNITGSIKDRMVFYIIKKAYEEKTLKPGMKIVEATSGNTGISLASIAALLKHEVHIFMPDWVSKERRKLLEMYGAKLHLVSREDGGFKEAIKKASEFAKENNAFIPEQFKNQYNVETYYNTFSLEILEKISTKKIGGFVSGIGTGGTIMGTTKRFKSLNPLIKAIAIEPDSLPILSEGVDQGKHKIEGIGDDFIPEIVDKNQIDEIILVNDNDAINMSKKLAKELGLGVGISSGANFLGSVIAKSKTKKHIITVFADDNKKYISTSLNKKISDNKKFVSNKIELINYEII